MSTAHGTLRYRALWAQLGPLGRVALLAALLGLIVLLLSSRSLISAALTPAPADPRSAANDQQQRQEQFKKAFEVQLAQINGRSLFFTPPPPRRPDAPPPPDPGPSAPTSYGGPTLLGFANGAAYFSDGSRLAPGQENDDQLKVKSLDPPWSVTVEWEGVEFTVSLFDRDRVVYPNKPSASPDGEAPASATAATTDPAPQPPADPAAPAEPAPHPKIETAQAGSTPASAGPLPAPTPTPPPTTPPTPTPPPPNPAAEPR